MTTVPKGHPDHPDSDRYWNQRLVNEMMYDEMEPKEKFAEHQELKDLKKKIKNRHIFVVINRFTTYADPCGAESIYNDDYKTAMSSPNENIMGIFSTKAKAQSFLNKSVVEEAEEMGYDEDEDKDKIEHLKDWHWYIEKYELDRDA